ncbi:MBL fold metallo-hydrolase [Klenkia brasiliensis]|uniref:L-ascorbate metabolism protein UlaG, beta-lactamase superfamily n=1 Tax=Klenkia brasiliensis TaxID=333142 RepID=A0A1G7NCU6_9ACTN|nr:MBL fold metallo-hydrolase [Klenkia brasiliensis]SDF71878.1 L-ascorbate metabolism protein UlaG, beta-lactamase superfamily [Klenkia brasiliensis]
MPTRHRPPLTAALTAALAVPAALVTRAAWGVPRALGAGRRALRPTVAGSPNFSDGKFRNTLPTPTAVDGDRAELVRELRRSRRRGAPARPVPLVTPQLPAKAADLAVTWFGHASALLEVDGARVLVDPVWGERVSPSAVVGPKRLHPVPGPLEELPRVDAVLISHDHYDHLDLPTVERLVREQDAPFVVPLGIGEHLRRWGVPADRVVELDWDGEHRVGELTLVCAEARHFSGRGLTRDDTLWSSWVVRGPRHRVFFGGDTGYHPAFAAIGAQHGPFDLTLLPVGAYAPQWPAIHMDPEEAVRAHGDLGGRVLLPIHWATFNLAFHAWAEPVDRLLAAAGDVPVVVPRPGERLDLTGDVPQTPDWWTAVAE